MTTDQYHDGMEPDTEPIVKKSKGLYLLLAVAAIGAAIGFLSMRGTGAATGDGAETALPIAPDFTVTLFDGTTFNLQNHLDNDGRPVILNLWASWCAPCRAEMPDFDAFAAERPGVLVLGIAVNDREDLARDLADDLGVTYPLGIDVTETVAAAYPPLGMPATWFIAEDGTIQKQITGQISLQTIREISAGSFGF